MRYYISDLHFFHDNLNHQMDNRGFPSEEEMNRYMIRRWNERVKRKDDVIILGDFSMGTPEQTMDVLRELAGKKYLITGNHDRYLHSTRFDTRLFQWALPYREMKDNGRKVVLCHYPIFCYNSQFRRTAAGNHITYMLYGHVHNTPDEKLVNRFIRETREDVRQVKGDDEPKPVPCQMINCFCMFSDYRPLTRDEWIEVDARRRAAIDGGTGQEPLREGSGEKAWQEPLREESSEKAGLEPL